MVAYILDFLVHRKYSLSLLRDKFFFSLNRSNGVSKKQSFIGTDLKHVIITLVKSAPKKILAKKPIFLGLGQFLACRTVLAISSK
jgi:hypothetical protein